MKWWNLSSEKPIEGDADSDSLDVSLEKVKYIIRSLTILRKSWERNHL